MNLVCHGSSAKKGCKIYTPASNIPETLAGTSSYLTTPSRDEHEAVWMRTKCIRQRQEGLIDRYPDPPMPRCNNR
jgi:hypothetical protein